MKKIISFILAIITIFTFSISAFAATGEQLEPNVGGSGIAYTEFEIDRTLLESNRFIRWHPSVSLPQQDVAFWHFKNSTFSISVNIAATALWGAFSASVGVNILTDANNADMSFRGEPYGWSRPCIRGDIYEITVEAGYYNFNTNQWASEPTIKTYNKVLYTTIGIERADTKEDLMG